MATLKKSGIIFIILAILVGFFYASPVLAENTDEYYTNTVEITTDFIRGELEETVDAVLDDADKSYSDVEQLIISNGELNTSDFSFINGSLTNLTTLTITSDSSLQGNDIPEYAFANNEKIQNVTIEPAVSVSGSAFYGATNLRSLSLPNLTIFGNSVFNYCYNLSELTLGATAPSLTDNYLFVYLPETRTVNIPVGSLASYGGGTEWNGWTISESTVIINSFTTGQLDNKFTDMGIDPSQYSDIKSLTIKSGDLDTIDFNFIQSNLTNLEILNIINIAKPLDGEVPANALSNMSELKSVTISWAETIGSYAFADNSNITYISIPRAMSIGSHAFENCSLIENLNLPKATTIGNSAFANCYSIETMNLSSVKTIEDNAFYYLINLSEVIMPEIENIGASAFKNNVSLSSLEMENLKTLATEAFYNCENLTSITLGAVPSVGSNAFSGTPNNKTAYVPALYYDAYNQNDTNQWQTWTLSEISGSDPSLSLLTTSVGDVSPEFNGSDFDNTEYTIDIGYFNSAVVISAVPAESTSVVRMKKSTSTNWNVGQTSTFAMSQGINTIDIQVTASSGIKLEYTLTLTRNTHVSINSVSTTNVTNYGDETGIITVDSVSGGSGDYEYSKDGGSTWQDSNAFTDLPAGIYSVVLRDANDTSNTDTESVTIAQPSQVRFSVDVTHVVTRNGNDGRIEISATGGSYNYEYSINGGVSYQDGNIFTNLSAGEYGVVVRDKNDYGNYAEETVQVLQPDAVTFTVSQTYVLSSNPNSGEIQITASGGNGFYEYSINNGSSWSENNTFDELPIGTYQVLVRDNVDTNNIATMQTIVLSNQVATSLESYQDIENYGESTGSITLSATGGVDGAVYEYHISGRTEWQTSNIFEYLAAGTYTLMARDSNDTSNVSDSIEVTLIQPDRVTISNIETTNIANYGEETGSITIPTAAGGKPGTTYEYSIDNGSTWQSNPVFSNLAMGNYTVVTRDANDTGNISEGQNVALSQPARVQVSAATTEVANYGESTGVVTVLATGGKGEAEEDYYYRIVGNGIDTDWQSDPVFSSIPAGTYEVYAQDKIDLLNISEAVNVTVEQPEQVSVSASTTDVSTYQGSDGSISLSATGGKGSYEYSIDNGDSWQENSNFSNLNAGTYSVLARDGEEINNVSEILEVTLTEPVAVQSTNVTDVTTYGGNDGIIEIIPTVELSTYQYSVNGGDSWKDSSTFSTLPAGTYEVMIRDRVNKSNQSEIVEVIVQQPVAIIDKTVTDATVYEGSDGIINIEADGGSGSYEYSVYNGQSWSSSSEFTGLPAGTYELLVRDINNRSDVSEMTSVTVLEPEPSDDASLSALTISDGILNPGFLTTQLEYETTVPYTVSELTIGATTSNENAETYIYKGFEEDIASSWLSDTLSSNTVSLDEGTNNINILVTAENGETQQLYSIEVTRITGVKIKVSKTDISKDNAADGSVTITASGGTETYEYSIDGGTTWDIADTYDNLGVGTYTILARDNVYPDSISDEKVITFVNPSDKETADFSSTSAETSTSGDSDSSTSTDSSSSDDSSESTTDDSTSDDTTDSTSSSSTESSVLIGEISGIVVDSEGAGTEGLTVELHSEVQTTTTDAAGEFVFADVELTEHELVVKSADGTEIQTFVLSISEGGEFTWEAADGTVNIVTASETGQLYFTIQVNDDMSGAEVISVTYSENPKTGVDYVAEILEGAASNSGEGINLVVVGFAAGMALVAGLIIFFVYMLIKEIRSH